jgi:hypothetical protein
MARFFEHLQRLRKLLFKSLQRLWELLTENDP